MNKYTNNMPFLSRSVLWLVDLWFHGGFICVIQKMACVIAIGMAGHATVRAEQPLQLQFVKVQPDRAASVQIPQAKLADDWQPDGVLDEPVWGSRTSSIATLTHNRVSTRLRAAGDAAWLYLAIDVDEPTDYTPTAQLYERDAGRPWQDDSIELWLSSGGPGATPVHLIVNRAGSIWDALGNDVQVNPDWQAAVRVKDVGWTVEARISIQSLFDLTGGEDGRGKVNLYYDLARNGWAIGSHSLSGHHGDVAGHVMRLRRASLSAKKAVQPTQASIALRFDRAQFTSGERWAAGIITFDASNDHAIELAVYRIGGRRPEATVKLDISGRAANVRIDMQSLRAGKLRVVARLLDGSRIVAADEAVIERAEAIEPPTSPIAVQILRPSVKNLPKQLWPVTFGVPVPEGVLWSAEKVRLVDAAGATLPATFEVAARWAPDGAIKWLRADALVDPDVEAFVALQHTGSQPRQKPRVTVRRRVDAIILDTGSARFELGPGSSPIRRLIRDGRVVATSDGARGLYVVDQNGRVATASAEDEQIVVEAEGPVAATVRFEGWYRTADGDQLARHITRVESFAGQSHVRVVHTLIITRDTNELWFTDMGWELSVPNSETTQALFATSRDDADNVATYRFDELGTSYAMVQDSHYYFGGGENHYAIKKTEAAGGTSVVHEDEECGDWAASIGRQGGIVFGCLDASRQHPKSFVVSKNKMALQLFTPGAGQTLDFRTKALLKKWRAEQWIQAHNKNGRVFPYTDDKTAALHKYVSNAAGWAKTHELLIGVTERETAPAAIGRTVNGHLRRHMARVDPLWSYKTLALGPNHPRDSKRFPQVERALDRTINTWLEQDAAWGEHGFVDYFGGPHISYTNGKTPLLYRYTYPSYTMRASLWLVYARGADRRVLDYAIGTNRARADNAYAHWQPKRGYFRVPYGPTRDWPFYWSNIYGLSNMENEAMNHLIWFHYLTGDRRARDVVLQFADVFGRAWSPGWVKGAWRVTDVVGLAAQMYAFTGDEKFAELAHATLDLIADDRSPVGLNRRAYDSSTYKNYQDLRSLIEACQILRSPKLREICLKMGASESEFPYRHGGYTPAGSVLGPFLYEQTGDRAQVQSVAHAVRRLGGLIRPLDESFNHDDMDDTQRTSFIFDLGYALHAMAEGGIDERSNAASWVWFDSAVEAARVIVRKQRDEAVRIHLGVGHVDRVKPLVTHLRKGVQPYDVQLLTVTQRNNERGQIDLPIDLPAGQYAITFSGQGARSLFASTDIQMVAHVEGEWAPMTDVNPPFRHYFFVPDDAASPYIHLSGRARLIQPDGQAWRNGQLQQGAIALPTDIPGLWAFEMLESGTVRLDGVPPVIAFNDPACFFLPADISP